MCCEYPHCIVCSTGCVCVCVRVLWVSVYLHCVCMTMCVSVQRKSLNTHLKTRRGAVIPCSPASASCVLTIDKSDDSLFVIDNTVVRRVTKDGAVTNIRVKGIQRLGEVEACVADGLGNLYITQKANHAIFKLTIIRNDGVLYRVAGQERAFGYKNSSLMVSLQPLQLK